VSQKSLIFYIDHFDHQPKLNALYQRFSFLMPFFLLLQKTIKHGWSCRIATRVFHRFKQNQQQEQQQQQQQQQATTTTTTTSDEDTLGETLIEVAFCVCGNFECWVEVY